MHPDTTRAYITKFALTKGIIVAHGVVDGEKLRVPGAYPWDWTEFKLGEWHTDGEKAIQRAAKMVTAETEKLLAKSQKLRTLTFTLPDLI
jgi:hypothetical protein